MTESSWRAQRNERSRARLDKARPAIFPAPVLIHALARPLIPPTPRRAVESYWRAHPIRADRLARALAALSGAPPGWSWRIGGIKGSGIGATLRTPPAPYRESAFTRGPGHCCICGQPVFHFGWHLDLWNAGKPNRNATWHSGCVVAWKLWTAPSEFAKPLRRHQKHRCAATARRLLKDAEVDHRTALFRVWRERGSAAWPELLGFWGVPNLQVINRDAHAAKCAAEAGQRARKGEAALP